MDRTRNVAVVIALVPLLAACGGTASASSPSVETSTVTMTVAPPTPRPRIVPKVSNCGIQKPTVKPLELIITCADANERATRIRWLTWTSTVAAGTTTLVANDCYPDCADGTMQSYAAEIVLDQVSVTTYGPLFSRLVLIFPDNRAHFGRTQIDDLPPYPSL